MNRATITGLLGGIIVAGFSLGAFAEVKDNPYQVIIERNPFGLRPPPPPPSTEAPAPPPAPPMEIKLTGITTLLGPPRVFLEFTDPQTKKTDRPPPFGEGDPYKDGISIVSIDAENGRVRIKNGDAETTLDFDKNGIKPAAAVAAAAPTPHPGFPNPAVPGVPTAAMPGGVAPVPAANSPARGAIVGGGSAPTATAAGNLGAFPARPLRTDNGAAIVGGYQTPGAQPQVPIPQQPTMTREQAEAMMEIQRQKLINQGNAAHMILPPTTIGRALNGAPSPSPVPTQSR